MFPESQLRGSPPQMVCCAMGAPDPGWVYQSWRSAPAAMTGQNVQGIQLMVSNSIQVVLAPCAARHSP